MKGKGKKIENKREKRKTITINYESFTEYFNHPGKRHYITPATYSKKHTISKIDDIIERWREYFKKFLDDHTRNWEKTEQLIGRERKSEENIRIEELDCVLKVSRLRQNST